MTSRRPVLLLALPFLAACEPAPTLPGADSTTPVPQAARICVARAASGLGVAWSDIAVTAYHSLPEGDLVLMTTGGKRLRCLTDIDLQSVEVVQLPG